MELQQYTQEELNAMSYALHDAIDELELNLNTVDDDPIARQEYSNQIEQLIKITDLLNYIHGTISN